MPAFQIQRLISPMDFEVFRDRFCAKNQLKFLNSGAFAEVVAHPKSDECYKISRLPVSEKDAYLEFLNLIRKKRNNPFLPKIKSLTFFEHRETKQKWYVVRMEKLRPLSFSRPRGEVESKTMVSPMARIVRKIMEDSNRKTLEDFEAFLSAMNLKSGPGKQLLEAVQVVKTGFGMADPDLHDGNMMLRKNGELVITDPIANLKPKSKWR